MLFGKRPPWYLYQSFLLLSVFFHDAPNKGTHSPVMHLTSLEFHHSEDLPEPLSFVATVLSRSTLGLNGSIIIASACHGLRCGCAAPFDSKGRVAYRFRRRQKEGKECAVLFGFQRTGGGYRESPLTFHAEKLRGLCAKILNFHKFFYFHKDSADFPADV